MIYSIMCIQCTYLLYLLSQLVTATKNPIGHSIEYDRSFFIFSLVILYSNILSNNLTRTWIAVTLLPIPVAVVV